MQRISLSRGLIGRAFQNKSTHAFQTAVALDGEGARAAKERSASAMMCEKGKLVAQHALLLITFRVAVPPLEAK